MPGEKKAFYPVMHIDTGRAWGGGQQQVLYLHGGLLKRGVASILVCRRGSALAKKAAAESIAAVEMEMKRGLGLLTAARIGRLARGHGVRTVHMHTSYAHSLGLGAARVMGENVHKVVSRRVAFPRKSSVFSRRKYVGRNIHYIAVSKAVKETLTGLGVSEDDISVVYSGIDVERFCRVDSERRKELAEEVRIRRGSFVVGSVGSLVACKGHAVLIEAVAEVEKRVPNIVCVIVGEGPYRGRLESLIRRKGLQGRVILAGGRKEVPEFLSLMDVFVMPSLQEGLGLALLEAMAAGKPVVASDVGGIPEVIRDWESGVLVRPGHAKALAERLLALREDAGRMSALARKAARRVRERFSRESMVEGTLRVYGSLG